MGWSSHPSGDAGAPVALVTGASGGIGATYAKHLAQAGYQLVLVARNESRMLGAVDQLTAAGAGSVEVIVADLTVADDLAKVADRLSDPHRPIDLLVNNAGLGLGKEFTEASREELRYQLNLNVESVMLLTHAALPQMVNRGRGAIINVASIAGLVPGRGSTYSASKAWVVAFSEALAMSYGKAGVRVQALCPGLIRTDFHERSSIDLAKTPNWQFIDIDRLVRDSLADLRRNKVVSVPSPLYASMAILARLAPRRVVRFLASKLTPRNRT